MFTKTPKNHVQANSLYSFFGSCQKIIVYFLLLFMTLGCNSTVVFKDEFNSTPIGQPPGPPDTGISSVDGNVRIAANPINSASVDRWLRLRRVSANTSPLSTYEGRLTERVTKSGSIRLQGYVPASAPITMSIYFEPPDIGPPIPLLHIDLMKNGDIRVNDNQVVGTYQYDEEVVFLITFDLKASPPMATYLVRGGGNDADGSVQVPAAAAGFGFGKIRVQAPFEGVSAPAGLFYVNDIVATKSE